MKTIAVVYPHIATVEWLKSSIASHRKKASNPIWVCVVDMTWKEAEHIAVMNQLRGLADHVSWLRVNPTKYRFACSLEISLPLVASIAPQDITVVSDTDVLMLRQGWDDRVRELLETHQVVSANPRSSWGPMFQSVVEWNWMAFNRGGVVGFSSDSGLTFPDWGQHVTAHLTGKQYLFEKCTRPFENKVCSIASDDAGPWIFHSFFGTSPAVGDNRDNCIQRGLCATSAEIWEMMKQHQLA